ncbi:hypothetical protein MPSEU_000577200 [Mayamaea pseudoterrestris]|nr:hypothetical protein MPSEU_000577200 [Mayamaea pseudoterrestris]
MAKRSRRNRRKTCKKTHSDSTMELPNDGKEILRQCNPESLNDESKNNAIADASLLADGAHLPETVLIYGCNDKDLNGKRVEQSDGEILPTSLGPHENSGASWMNCSTVESKIGLVHSATNEDNLQLNRSELLLSPIAFSRELRASHDMGEWFLTVSPDVASVSGESTTSSGDAFHSAGGNQENGTAHESLRRENIHERLDEDLNDQSSQTRHRQAILSQVVEADQEFEAPELHWEIESMAINEADADLLGDHEQFDTVDESVMTTGSARDDEIARTQEELGATSLAFLHRLRGAAFRRKKALVHSRDDMVAKEKSHRQGIEAARMLRRQSEYDGAPHEVEPDEMDKEQQATNTYTFKARPAPNLDLAGSLGVPKVDKRPVTVPHSPLLGLRRLTRPSDRSMGLGAPLSETGAVKSFTALPLPKTTGLAGRGGLSGLPKVPKRLFTDPVSPILGPRRQEADNGQSHAPRVKARPPTSKSSFGFKALPIPKSLRSNGASGVPRIPTRPTTVPWSPRLGLRRKNVPASATTADDACDTSQSQSAASISSAVSSLLGVKLLSTPFSSSNGNENELPNATAEATARNESTSFRSSSSGYEPRSTARAKKRAEFDTYLTVREKERHLEESQRRFEQAKAIKRELNELRKGL